MTNEMHLVVLLRGAGMHEASWRHSSADASAIWDPRHYLAMSVLAERGHLDAVFITDELSSPAGQGGDDAVGRFEPLTLLSFVAAGTQRIGLVATASTTFSEPYNLARMFATLDHVSGGRAGWNIVTSASDRAAQNFGVSNIVEHDERYVRAGEYVELVRQLWASWADDAVLADPSRPFFADLAKIRQIDFKGRFYQSRGPLNIPPGPQRYPVLFQAGSSPAGIGLAGSCADAVFTVAREIETARAFRDQLRHAATGQGRDPNAVKVLPGIVPFIGSTDAEAQRLQQELDDLADIERSITQLSIMLGADLTGSDPDGPVPDLTGSRNDSRANAVRLLGQRADLTLRGLVKAVLASRGHQTVTGSPERIADYLQAWLKAGAADGFTVAPPVVPDGLRDFVDHVVPILCARGLFRREYTGRTLRDHLGIPVPAGSLR